MFRTAVGIARFLPKIPCLFHVAVADISANARSVVGELVGFILVHDTTDRRHQNVVTVFENGFAVLLFKCIGKNGFIGFGKLFERAVNFPSRRKLCERVIPVRFGFERLYGMGVVRADIAVKTEVHTDRLRFTDRRVPRQVFILGIASVNINFNAAPFALFCRRRIMVGYQVEINAVTCKRCV